MSKQPQPSHKPEPKEMPKEAPQAKQPKSDAVAPPQRPQKRGQGERYTDIPNSQVLHSWAPHVLLSHLQSVCLSGSLLSKTRLPLPCFLIFQESQYLTQCASIQIRKIIAKRLLDSKMEVPHYYLRGHADLRTVNSLRQMFKEQGSKVRGSTTQLPCKRLAIRNVSGSCFIPTKACQLDPQSALGLAEQAVKRCALQVSVNDFIVRATALALADVPRANLQWDAKSGEVVPCQGVDISIAVATDKGLITPIVKDADKKSLTQISAEVSAFSPFVTLLDCLSATQAQYEQEGL